ncbi:MAG: hypothetical protein ACOCQ2_02610 [Halanaerobiales bacterium]
MRKILTYIFIFMLVFSFLSFASGDRIKGEEKNDFLEPGEHYVIFGEFEDDKRSMSLIEVEEIQGSWIRVNIVESKNELLEEANRSLDYEGGVIEDIWLNTGNIYMVLSEPDLDYWTGENNMEE